MRLCPKCEAHILEQKIMPDGKTLYWSCPGKGCGFKQTYKRQVRKSADDAYAGVTGYEEQKWGQLDSLRKLANGD